VQVRSDLPNIDPVPHGPMNTTLAFGAYRLDPQNEQLWRDQQVVRLTGKAFAILRHLVQRPNQLVSRAELFRSVWPDTVVSATTLTSCIKELRKALNDDARTPQYIETVHRRGYRFIGQVVSGQSSVVSPPSIPPLQSQLTTENRQLTTHLVGREQEMAELCTSLEKVIAGHGQLTLLVGEAGIGKTRTAEELAAHARSRNVRVLIGRCHEGEGAPPFWPWVQIVRSYLADHDPAAARIALGPGAATIAQVIPDVYEHLPDLPIPPSLESQPARFRFFDSFTAFLKREARAQPLVLILDDLHWADRSSLLFLQFLARELNNTRLFILGTCRDVGVEPGHPLTQTLGELARVAGSQNLSLHNLTESDVARFIELTTARTPAAALVTAIFQKTTGNPFFVTEVVQALLRDGHLEQEEELDAASLPLPQRVRVTVEHRLGELSEACRQVLTTAAVVGSVFDLAVLKAVEDSSRKPLSGNALLEVLDDAVAARFVSHDPNNIGRYRFSHALVRETLYATLSTEQRIQLHRQVGEALEQLWNVETEPSRSTSSGKMLSELAFHFFQAAPGGNTCKAMTYTVQAGERATALFAYEEAVSHYQHALQLLALQPGDELHRCELLLALGDAQRRAGNTTAARETFRAVVDLARILRMHEEERQASSLLARAALGFAPGFGGITVAGGVEDPFVVNLLEEALQALGPEESPLQVRVLSRLAMELYWSNDAERRATLSQEAIASARRMEDPIALASALNARHVVLREPGNAEERLAIATEMMGLARKVDDKELTLRGHLWRLTDLLELGDLPTADREISVYVQRAEELQQPSYLWFLAVWNSTRMWLRGKFAEAQRFAYEALQIGQRAQDPDADQCFIAQILGQRAGVKHSTDIELPVQNLADQYTALPVWRSALALVYTDFGVLDEARREFEPLAANDFADLPQNEYWMITMSNLAQVSILIGDHSRAAAAYRLLLPYAERCVVVKPALVCLGLVSRLLGRLAAMLERWDEAEAHFVAALQGHKRMRAKPLITLTQEQYATMLLARNQLGDDEQSKRLLEEALASAQALGMDVVTKRILALNDKIANHLP